MKQEHKILNKFNRIWQLHNKCVMIGLVFISLVIITGWIADRLTDSSRYLSTASIVVSIALSLVVIGYTLTQNVRAEINADRVGRLFERVEEGIYRLEKDVSILGEKFMQVSTKEDEETITDTAKQVGKGQVFFSLKLTSDISRLFAYFLLQSNTLKRPLPIEQFVLIADPIVKMSTTELKSFVYGILHGMACCLEGFLRIEEQTHVQLSKLPNNFKQHLEVVTAWMKDRNPDLADCLSKINNII